MWYDSCEIKQRSVRCLVYHVVRNGLSSWSLSCFCSDPAESAKLPVSLGGGYGLFVKALVRTNRRTNSPQMLAVISNRNKRKRLSIREPYVLITGVSKRNLRYPCPSP